MPRTRTSSTIELLVEMRREDPEPLHRQLEQGLRDAIRSGRLAATTVLPSTRVLADQLDLSRGVVVEAYEQLVAEGYLESRQGGATRVAQRATTGSAAPHLRPATRVHHIDFSYGRADVTQFPRAAWLRSVRRVLNDAPSERLAYLEGRGAVELRDALAGYLNRVRGTAARGENTVISNGFAQAITLLAEVLGDRGARAIAVEDPGQPDTAAAIRRAGLQAVPVPVDDAGIDAEALARTGADAVLVTPAHCFPTGAVMTPERRAALVAWAVDGDRLIIEDDYDAEYRYDREPIGAIQGLAPEHVAYAGTASKTLAPGLRLGWLILPTSLVDPVAILKEAADRGSAIIEQLAFADFLTRGEFDRHLRHMRPIYRARRDRLLQAMRRYLPELRPVGASAGLHVIAWLPPAMNEAQIIERASDVGVGLYGLSGYFGASARAPGGLLFGYGSLTEDAIEEGIRLVAGAIHQSPHSPAATRIA